MAKIKAFKGIFYNQKKIKDLSRVTCPPYDIINSKKQNEYYKNSKYNIIRLELGKDKPSDNECDNKYTRARGYFDSWFKEGVLIRDDKPHLYLYQQQFVFAGKKKSRFGFIGAMKLLDEEEYVFRHEYTHSAPKQDRLNLIRQTSANLSPIFVLFDDKKKYINKLKLVFSNKKPIINTKDYNGFVNKIWKIDDENLINQITSFVGDEAIFIADGHHRFEVGQAFSKECFAINPLLSPEEDFNYIMTYFTSLAEKGLVIMPMHRLLKGIDKNKLSSLKEFLAKKFLIESVDNKAKLLFNMCKKSPKKHHIGLYLSKKFYMLTLKNEKLALNMDIDEPRSYKLLDITILNNLIFKDYFSLNLPHDNKILYTHDDKEAVSMVDKDRADACFFLNPVTPCEITNVALSGRRMPPKSTYFYPKLLTGLIINKLNQ